MLVLSVPDEGYSKNVQIYIYVCIGDTPDVSIWHPVNDI